MSKEELSDKYTESESVENSSQEEDEQWDDWNEDEDDEEKTQSLFDKNILSNPDAAISYDAEKHGFDLKKFIVKARLDDYGVIRVVNYVRREVAAGRNPLPLLLGDSTQKPWESDDFLKPVLMEDPLLFHDYTPYMTGEEFEDQRRTADGDTKDELLHRMAQENAALREALEKLRAVAMPEELREELAGSGGTRPAEGEADEAKKGAEAPASEEAAAAAAAAAQEAKKIDRAYFDSYSSFNIHREMISDHPRTESYRQALEQNPSLVRGKRVLDVGCGTGILSLFACRGGAARVVSIDGSDRMAKIAKELSVHNGFGDKMEVVAGRLETITSLPLLPSAPSDTAVSEGGAEDDDGKVDVLVSEWMGYALLFETMLDTVLRARDRFLRPGGAVLPDRATILVGAAAEAALDLGFWKRVYGFDFGPVAEDIRAAGVDRAQVAVVEPGHILSLNQVCVKDLDLSTMRSEDQDFTAEFSLDLAATEEEAAAAAARQTAAAAENTVNGAAPLTTTAASASSSSSSPSPSSSCASSGPLSVGALLVWFETAFSERFCKEHPALLSTAPFATATHWAQTVLPLETPVPVNEYGRLSGRISMARSRSEHRCLDIAVEYRAHRRDGVVAPPLGAEKKDLTQTRTQIFRMSVTAPA